MTQHLNRPHETEFASYYGTYVKLAPGADILQTLNAQGVAAIEFLRSIPASKEKFRYAPDKWSVRESIGHVIDTERIFAYRALRFARGDNQDLRGFEQNSYVQNAIFDDVPVSELILEFENLRNSTHFFFKHLTAEAWDRRGTASDNEITVRALAYIITGHEIHHRNILRERYL